MLSPQQVLDNYFLEARCMLLEVAATLDRYDRAATDSSSNTGPGGAATGGPADNRLEKLRESLFLLAQEEATPDRAERLLKLFSGPE
jgi:hypothetical protein